MLGNTLSNLCNNGLAAAFKGDIYFVNVYRGEDLYRVCGKMYSQITGDKVKNLNIIDNIVYYVTLTGELKSIDINGENEKSLLDGHVEGIIATESYIFYIDVLDNYSIYKYDLKTLETKKISSDICDKINILDENLYYIKCSNDLDWYGSGSIYKVDINGKNSEEILDVKTSNIILDGDFLYFTSEEENHKLCRVSLSTKEVETIIEDQVGSFNILDGVVYYGDLSDEGKLYKCNITANVSEKISDDIPENINIVNDYLYFANASYGYPYRLYKMKLNGEEKQMI